MMVQDETRNGGTAANMLTAAANWTVRIVGTAIFVWLSWYAMRYTQYIVPLKKEIPVDMHDSEVKNLIALALAIGVIVVLGIWEKRLAEHTKTMITRGVLLLTCVIFGVAAFWWVSSVDRQPVGDQAFIYGGATYFMQGDYTLLEDGGYCRVYPHQLGLISLMELLFRFVGPKNYYAFQYLSACLAVGILVLGYILLRQITKNMTVAITYCLMMWGCIPLVLYTSWVYGEVPSIFFSLLTAVCLMQYTKDDKIRWLICMVLAIIMAVLVRQNSLIMLVAVCLVGGVYMICRLDN